VAESVTGGVGRTVVEVVARPAVDGAVDTTVAVPVVVRWQCRSSRCPRRRGVTGADVEAERRTRRPRTDTALASWSD
jgi:hypothetical protein